MKIHKKTEIISLVQARTSSSRLPGKVLLPLGKTNVLNNIISRAKLFSKQVIVCTSTNSEDDQIEEYCNQLNIFCSRGSLKNVFDRFQSALLNPKTQEASWFARLTGDNPLVSVELAKILIEKIDDAFDYIAFDKNLIPNGSGIELINKQTFLKIESNDLDKYEKEHVTLRLYEKENLYKCKILKPPRNYRYPEMRITLDYKEDYFLLKKLFDINEKLDLKELIKISKKNELLFKINSSLIQKDARK